MFGGTGGDGGLGRDGPLGERGLRLDHDLVAIALDGNPVGQVTGLAVDLDLGLEELLLKCSSAQPTSAPQPTEIARDSHPKMSTERESAVRVIHIGRVERWRWPGECVPE